MIYSWLRAGLALSMVGVVSACAGGGVIHTAPDESQPHITWEIRVGGEFGDADFVCGSSKPGQACVLPSGASTKPTTVMLRLYLHAAALQTNYLGVWRAPFLEGWTQKDYREVSGAVRHGDRPFSTSVSGLVTDKPGAYGFNVLLDAAQEGIPAGHRIVLDIPVTVTRAAGAPN